MKAPNVIKASENFMVLGGSPALVGRPCVASLEIVDDSIYEDHISPELTKLSEACRDLVLVRRRRPWALTPQEVDQIIAKEVKIEDVYRDPDEPKETLWFQCALLNLALRYQRGAL